MNEYFSEYKRNLFHIEDLNIEINALNIDIHSYNDRISFIDGILNDRIGNLEINLRILENEKLKIESLIRNNKLLKNKLKTYLISTGISSLVTAIFLSLSLFDTSNFFKFLVCIFLSISILLISSSCKQLCRFFRNKINIKKCDMNVLDNNIENRKREINRKYCENKLLIQERVKLQKLIDKNRNIINDRRSKLNQLRHEGNKLSRMLLDSIYEEVKDSYCSELDGQLEIPGVKSYVKRKNR